MCTINVVTLNLKGFKCKVRICFPPAQCTCRGKAPASWHLPCQRLCHAPSCPALPSGAPLLSHSLSGRVHTSTVSSTRANRRDRLLAHRALHRLEAALGAQRTGPVPAFQKSPQRAVLWKGSLLRCVCALRKLTANQAAQTQPACSQRGEATLGSRSVGLAQTHHVGRRDISTLARESRETRGEAQHSTAQPGRRSQGHDWARPGPPAIPSALPGTWKGRIQGLPPGRLSEPSSVC